MYGLALYHGEGRRVGVAVLAREDVRNEAGADAASALETGVAAGRVAYMLPVDTGYPSVGSHV